MELYWLEYFQKIARYGSVSKAAEKIHISQPALSKTLALLEDELGVQLFDRVGRKIEINRYGEVFQERVNEILAQLENVKNELEMMKEDEAHKVSVCINTGNRFITNRMLEFMTDHPEIKIEFTSWVTNIHEFERCDVVVTYNSPSLPPFCEGILLYDEEIIALVSEKQFPEFSDSIKLNDCKNLNFSLPERTGRIDDLRELYDMAFQKFGYSPKIIHQSTALDQVRTQLLMGRCITLVPYGITTIMDLNGLKMLKISDYNLIRSVGAYWLNSKGISEDAMKFIEYLKMKEYIFTL